MVRSTVVVLLVCMAGCATLSPPPPKTIIRAYDGAICVLPEVDSRFIRHHAKSEIIRVELARQGMKKYELILYESSGTNRSSVAIRLVRDTTTKQVYEFDVSATRSGAERGYTCFSGQLTLTPTNKNYDAEASRARAMSAQMFN